MTDSLLQIAHRRPLTTGVIVQFRNFVRDPLNVVLLVGLPVFVVVGFGEAMSSFPETAAMELAPENAGRVLGALFSTAFLTGLFGLYQGMDSWSTDERLVAAGYPFEQLLGARLVSTLAVGVLLSLWCLALLWVRVPPTAPLVAAFVLVGSGLIYALIGVLIGTFAPDLFEGSLILLFVADMDAFLGSGMSRAGATNPLLPLYYPLELFQSAVVDGHVLPMRVVGMGTYLLVLTGVTYLGYMRTLGDVGPHRGDGV